MLDIPASRLSSNRIGMSKCAPNNGMGSRYRESDRNDATIFTLLEPAFIALDVPASVISTAQVFIRSMHFTLHSIYFLPANPHDPGPQDRLNQLLHLSVSLIIFIIAVSVNTSSITFPTITKFATYDYSLITPRSPQCIYVLCFL